MKQANKWFYTPRPSLTHYFRSRHAIAYDHLCMYMNIMYIM